MAKIKFSKWELDIDAAATKAVYAKLSGGPEACGCDPCKNFIANRSEIYPADIKDFSINTGIDLKKELEVFHNGRLKNGNHSYGGWFFMVGKILSGPIAVKGQQKFESITDAFRVNFQNQVDLAPQEIEQQHVIQLNFSCDVPWTAQLKEPL